MNTLLLALLCLQETEVPKTPVPQEKEIVIIGQRRESDTLDVPSALTVITSKQIAESGATNLVEIVQRQPGFFAQGQHKGAYDQIVDIRGYNNGGGNGQRVLVLVDGRKTNGVVTSSTEWASIPVGNIERIEIVRGPAAALYGDAALAGVVNIITKKGGKESFNTAVTTGGNWGTYAASANFGGAAGGALYDFFAGTEGTEGWRDHGGYAGTNFSGRVEAPLTDSLRWFTKIGGHTDHRERPGTLTRDQIRTWGRNASDPTRQGEMDLEERTLDTGLTQSLGGAGELSLFANHSWAENLQDSGGYIIRDHSEISMLQLKHTLATDLAGLKAALTAGVDLSLERADSDSGFDPDWDESEYRRRTGGGYLQAEVRPLDFLILSGGARYDRALLDLDRDIGPFGWGDQVDRQREFGQWSPYWGVTVKPIEEMAVYGSWGRTFKYPTRDELLGFFQTNPELDPERAKVTEIGVRGRAAGLGSASMSWYRMVVEDEIFYNPDFPYDTPFGTFTGHNVNFEEITHQGVESEARFTPFPWLELFGTHTFTRAVVTESEDPTWQGKKYPVTPRLMGSAGLTVRHEGAALTLTGRYAGQRYLINDFDNVVEKLGSYWVVDGRLSYTAKPFTAYLSVYNIEDEKYLDSGGTNLRFNTGPERSWTVGGEVTF